VRGAVARGHLRTDVHFFTGKTTRSSENAAFAASLLGVAEQGAWAALILATVERDSDVATFPFPVTRKVLEHGRNRYAIYCVVCHDPLGTGRGKIVERGYTPPPSYHIERLRQEPPGHFFRVITNGYGSMPDYKQQIPPADRWAIVAYVRALQLSQHFLEKDLSPDMRDEWERQRQTAESGGPVR
jgi:mono/diheme cytochrome c family protein